VTEGRTNAAPQDPFAQLEPTSGLERVAVSYLRWGARHRAAVTALCLASLALVCVLFWQLFGVVPAIVALATLAVLGVGMLASLIRAGRRTDA
jgi:hypothetical protein